MTAEVVDQAVCPAEIQISLPDGSSPTSPTLSYFSRSSRMIALPCFEDLPTFDFEAQSSLSVPLRDSDEVVNISTREQVKPYDSNIKVAHLNRQQVINVSTIRTLIEYNPHLSAIEIAPSAIRLCSHSLRRLLTENDVDIKIGGIPRPTFNRSSESKQQQELGKKRTFFRTALEDPQKHEIFLDMLGANVLDAWMTAIYLGEVRIPQRLIAEQFKTREFSVQRGVGAILHILGLETDDFATRCRANVNKAYIDSLKTSK
jgi:hypothetical protein